MSTTQRWTSADLDSLPDDGTRYEIIDGELFMSKSPHLFHARACSALHKALSIWNDKTDSGEVFEVAGLVFASDNDVIPDVMWISRDRVETALRADGHLHEAPELVIEVLSPGSANERRDRVAKLDLYSRSGVDEYWIVSWQTHSIDVFRRVGDKLTLAATLRDGDVIESSLLPGFACAVSDIFCEIPIE
jgi:Uma2 family endonuclease